MKRWRSSARPPSCGRTTDKPKPRFNAPSPPSGLKILDHSQRFAFIAPHLLVLRADIGKLQHLDRDVTIATRQVGSFPSVPGRHAHQKICENLGRSEEHTS